MEEVVVWELAPAGRADEVWVERTVNAGDITFDPLLRNALASEDGLADMSELQHLHEPGMLHNLQLRCEAGRVYTWCGDVCVSVNPYSRDVVWDGHNGRQRR